MLILAEDGKINFVFSDTIFKIGKWYAMAAEEVTKEIEEIRNRLAEWLMPRKIYLFGSYADGTYGDDSDYDFYVIVDDDAGNLADLTAEAYTVIGNERQHPVDILMGKSTRFKKMKTLPTIENEVYRRGVLLYGGSD